MTHATLAGVTGDLANIFVLTALGSLAFLGISVVMTSTFDFILARLPRR